MRIVQVIRATKPSGALTLQIPVPKVKRLVQERLKDTPARKR